MIVAFVPEVFGRLTTLDAGYIVLCGKHRRKFHKVLCVCGTVKEVMRSCLVSGDTQSCGCLYRETRATKNITHGHVKGGQATPEYLAWQNMRARCRNPRVKQYKDYGGRGIRVFPEWNCSGVGFERWLAHIGPRPSKKHSQDRFPNPDGNYEPGNVRWATKEEQNNNTTRNVVLTHGGKTMTLAQWSREIDILQKTISTRLRLGWTVEKALTTPVKQREGLLDGN